jgi:hypothetical protein
MRDDRGCVSRLPTRKIFSPHRSVHIGSGAYPVYIQWAWWGGGGAFTGGKNVEASRICLLCKEATESHGEEEYPTYNKKEGKRDRSHIA